MKPWERRPCLVIGRTFSVIGKPPWSTYKLFRKAQQTGEMSLYITNSIGMFNGLVMGGHLFYRKAPVIKGKISWVCR